METTPTVADAFAARVRAPRSERLSPLAARSYPAVREHPEDDCALRTPFQRDRDRIVHCKSFRRLKHKTQVFVAPEGDHYRTRLTHTLEVTAISRTVARALDLNEDLVEAIGLGHDLGHPPFGHIGEAALDDCLRERFGRGFRHYEHSLRVVDVLERDGRGLNLTADVRDGILCHSGPGADAADARGADRAARRPRSPTSTTTSTTRCAPACSPRRDLPAERDRGARARRAARGSTGSSTTSSSTRRRPATSSRATRSARRWTSCGTFMFDDGLPRARPRGARPRRSSGSSATLFDAYVARPARLPDGGGAPGADLAQRVTDYIAGHDRPLRDAGLHAS